MSFAQGSRSQLLSKAQSAFGSAASGNYTKLKFVSHSLSFNTATIKSQTVRSDREIADYRLTTQDNGGDIVSELSYADFDDLIASALFSTWGTDSISNGTTPSYLSLEDGALDIARYRLYRDMLVTKWALKMSPGAIVQSTFSLVGTDMTPGSSTSGGTAVDASTNQPFDALTGSIYDDAAESGSALANVTGLDLTIDNGAKSFFTVGSRQASALEYGMCDVSGQLTLAYQDGAFTSRYVNETEFGLSFSLTDPAGNSLEFQMPRIKLGGDSVPVSNPQTRIMTVPFQALKPTSGSPSTTLTITKA